ncbi:MAG TPA: hypothetical protein VLB47_01795, partial [Solirubrobacteraceae bacterium]|nr:hypothetical protein [Solirubrobacteraceae bacterium]
MRRAASWALALAAAVALAAGALLTYAEHTVFRSGAFADRAAASLEEPAVRAAVARRLGDVAIGAKPDLVAIRPIVEAAARGVVSTAAFRSLLRRAVHDAHRSAFNGEADAVTLRVRDAGLLLAAGVRRFRPDLAERFPVRVPAGVARVAGGFNGFLLSLAQRAERARVAIPIAFGLALVLALAAVVVTRSARLAALRLGAAVAVVGAVVALASSLGPRAVAANAGGADREAVRAAVAVWLDPLTAWAVAAAAAGLVVALAAAAVLRPLPVAAL